MEEEDKVSKALLAAYTELGQKLPNMQAFKRAYYNNMMLIVEHDVGLAAAIDQIATENTENAIELDDDWANHVYQKLSKLLFLKQMTMASGMGDYTDQIMRNTIDYLFPSEKPRPNKPKETAKSRGEK